MTTLALFIAVSLICRCERKIEFWIVTSCTFPVVVPHGMLTSSVNVMPSSVMKDADEKLSPLKITLPFTPPVALPTGGAPPAERSGVRTTIDVLAPPLHLPQLPGAGQ